MLFLAALPLAPLLSLIPSYAAAPVLILAGAVMMAEAARIDYADIAQGLPCFLTIASMSLASSIATGFDLGFTLLIVNGLITFALMWLFRKRQ